MKYISLFVLTVGSLFLQTVSAETALTSNKQFDVIGFSTISGTLLEDCSLLELPKLTDAEASADQQAANYCAEFGLSFVRVSDYTYTTNNCVWGGPQYHYPSNHAYAEAYYRCE